jgi:hypothetical protein
MTTLDSIREEVEGREIGRLAHFTPLRNLVHIATGKGLLSTKYLLTSEERSACNPVDLERLDGFPDHISCTIEYPNAYYLRSKRKKARGEERIFPDWVCLLLERHHLWRKNTLFCRHNAAGVGGANVKAGLTYFREMFADCIDAPQGSWQRTGQPACCPTDAQAEVLVHRRIPLGDVLAIAVETDEQAVNTWAVLMQLKAPVEHLPLIVAPSFYTPMSLFADLADGRRPVERAWHPPERARARAGETHD